MKFFNSLFVPLLVAASAAAHGYLQSITIDGKVYQGQTPNNPPSNVQSAIRQVKDISPVKGASNPDLNCGASAVPSALIANANPGSKIDILWSDINANWPHNTGPLMTYMASCGSTPCSQFDSTKAQWFKIDQIGTTLPGVWAQAQFQAGKSVSLNLPSTLAPGNYLFRQEIIALHLAVTVGGAEFYPSCTQLTIGGSQTGGPQPNELVSFPGAYNDRDPGIFDPNVFNSGASYTFPGPNIAAFVNGGASGSGSSSSNSNSTSSTSGSPPSSTSSASTSSSSGSTKAGTCKLKHPSSSSASASASAVAAIVVRPRHISRVMRRLITGSYH